MGIMQALFGAAAVAAGFKVKNSLRFRGGIESYLGRSAGMGLGSNPNKMTYSGWIKLGVMSYDGYVFDTVSGSTAFQILLYNTGTGGFRIINYNGSTNDVDWRSSGLLLRDPTAWYHLYVTIDLTLAAGSRTKVFLNGVQYTNTGTNVDSAASLFVGGNYAHYISAPGGGDFNAFVSQVVVTAGAILPISNFAEFNANGVWVPKQIATPLPANTVYFKFEDASSVAALGTDSSGNGLTFVPNNMVVSPPTSASMDQMVDTPTNNFATLNSVFPGTSTLTNANLTSAGATVAPTITPTSGTWYLERDGVALTWTPPAAFPAAAGNYNFGQRPFTNTPTAPTLCTDNIGIVAPTTSGSFTGNGSADGPVVWTGGVPTTLSIDGSANLIGTSNVDKLAGGFKLRSATNNAAGTRNWTATYASPSTNSSFGQPQPAQINP